MAWRLCSARSVGTSPDRLLPRRLHLTGRFRFTGRSDRQLDDTVLRLDRTAVVGARLAVMTPPDRPFTAGRIGWACMIENAGAMQLTVSSGGDGRQLHPFRATRRATSR